LQEPLQDANRTLGIPLEHPTISSLLKGNNYESILIGKYHLGNDPKFHPLNHGFTEFYGIIGSSASYFSHRNTTGSKDLWDNMSPVESDLYLTNLFTDRAVQFIRRERTRPFYMSLHYNAPHWPWEGPNDREKGLSTPRAAAADDGSAEIYGEMMKSMDQGIGRVLQAVRDRGLERNTLIIFTSDNGGERYSNNWPFSFRKLNLWEGGIRVPAIARWTGVIPAGRTTAQAAVTMDWTATILSATGTRPDPAYALDGMDLLRVCTGEQQPVDRTLFWRNRVHDAARIGKWKYLKENNQEHLFDLSNDPGEKSDLKEKEASTFSRLQAAYLDWNSKVLPRPTPAARGARGAQAPN
jgi:arylsulfatase A-like enzyme